MRIPTKPTKEFEDILSWWVGKRPCDKCGKPLGIGPRFHKHYKQYHPKCYDANDKQPKS